MVTRVLIMLTLGVSLVQAADNPSPSPTASAAPTPTEASVKQLLEVAQTHKLVDAVMKQIDNLTLQAIAQATRNQPIS
ncbi:MAG TPA: hypothetical protein VLH83_07690, partial [Chthoniobacterales bacterium]|nr:hypothetical protein [Chthoniobacterales bacterium]